MSSKRKRSSTGAAAPVPRNTPRPANDQVSQTDYFACFDQAPGGTQQVWNKAMEAASAINISFESERLNPTDLMQVAPIKIENIERWEELENASRRLGLDLPWTDPSLIAPHNLLIQSYCFRRLISSPLEKIYKNISDIRARLKSHANLSNNADVGSIGTATHEAIEANEMDDSQYAEMMKGVHIQSPTEEQKEVQHFLESDEIIQRWWQSKNPKDGDLEMFAEVWNNLVLLSNKSDDAKTVQKEARNVVAEIVGWREKTGVISTCGGLRGKKIVFPSDTSLEKEGVQPILAAVLFSLSQIDCRDQSHEDGHMPATRSDQRRERFMPQTRGHGKRFVDFESRSLNPFVPQLLYQEISLLKEVKNVRRKNRNASSMHDEGSKQIVGHLAKRALVAFDVADVGIDSTSLGVIMTPVYIQVIRLQVQNMGKSDVSMQIQRTKLFPLVNEKAFNAFVQKEEDKDYLRPHLYPPTKVEAAVSDPPKAQSEATGSTFELPEGIRVLWELLHSTDCDLGTLFFDESSGATYFDHGKTQAGLAAVNLLGSGSQGLVYAVAGEQNAVVKSSVVGELRYIERELKALQNLSSAQPGSIPRLSGVGRIEYKIRKSVASVPALLISPKGIPVSKYLMSMESEEKSTALLSLWANGLEALEFAHQNKVFHLDVSPRNFVWYESGNRFVLIDWGCASCEGEQVRGFRGSLPFAHAEVHAKGNKDTWSPSEKHDRASLVFTVCALHMNNPVPWKGFNARLEKSNLALKTRRETSTQNVMSLIKRYKEEATTVDANVTPGITLYGIDAEKDRLNKLKTKIEAEVKDA